MSTTLRRAPAPTTTPSPPRRRGHLHPVPVLPGVAVVHWPAEATLRAEARRLDTPRLLLVDPGAPLPVAIDLREDWMFADSSEHQVVARALALRDSAAGGTTVPVVDEHDLLRYDHRWLALAPTEALVLRLLLGRIGRCVPRTELARCFGGDDGRLRGAVRRLRARVADLGIEITTVRGRGLVLSLTAPGHRPAAVTGAS